MARGLVDEVLGPLDRYDAQHGTALRATLAAYLACSGATSVAAGHLHVHPNAVNQRLDRIMAILQCDIREYPTVSRMLLALEWPWTPPAPEPAVRAEGHLPGRR